MGGYGQKNKEKKKFKNPNWKEGKKEYFICRGVDPVCRKSQTNKSNKKLLVLINEFSMVRDRKKIQKNQLFIYSSNEQS